VVLLAASWKKTAVGLEGVGVGVGVDELVGMTVEIASPTRTYNPDFRPASTTDQSRNSPLSSYRVTTAGSTVVTVTVSRPLIGEPFLAAWRWTWLCGCAAVSVAAPRSAILENFIVKKRIREV
jgi:hypothetical protein